MAKKKPTPVIPPPGWYDPALDAQRRASHRGLGDLRRDNELAGARASQDYTFGIQGLQQSRDRGYQDIDRQVQMLTRQYGELGRTQAEGNAQAGVMNAHFAAKQGLIRAANMAVDRQPLDTARTRLGEDYATGSGRLGVELARGTTDRATGLARAGREDTQFGLDIGEQERFQAIQGGWAPPPDPKKRKQKFQTWRSPSPRLGGGRLTPVARPAVSWGGFGSY